MAQAHPKVWLAGESQSVETSHRNRGAITLGWVLLGLSFAAFLAGVVLLLIVPASQRKLLGYGDKYLFGLVLLSYSALGVMIAARHPENIIGWIFLALGLSTELQVLAIGFMVYARTYLSNSINTSLLIFSLAMNLWVTRNALAPMAYLSFPNGKFLSSRWRFVAWFTLILGLAMYLLSTPAPVAGLSQAQILSPIELLVGKTSLNFRAVGTKVVELLFEVMFILATIGIFQRLRQARGELREQMKWCVFAVLLTVTIGIGLDLLFALPVGRVLSPGAYNSEMQFLAIPSLLAYLAVPIATFIAIFKYRLYDIDLIINRTLVYVPLTAILAGMYAASVTLFQKLFIASTGQKSDAAIVISTLILATAFTPIKNSLQTWVDERFKEAKDPLKELKAFSNQIETVAQVIDTRRTTRRLLEMSVSAFHASCGAIYLERDGEMVVAHSSDGWKDECGILEVPLVQDGAQLGMLVLGARSDQKGYTPEDCKTIQHAADNLAEMIWLTRVTTQAQ